MAFKPVISSNSDKSNLNQINDMVRSLNKEQITKTFKQPNGNSIINGKLPNGRYGTLYYDSSNNSSILIGQHPVDGHMVIALVKPGLDVLEELEA
jgi:hypothetical protein